MAITSRSWFITGASRGLGRAMAEFVLNAGDRVILSVRDPSSVADLVNSHPASATALKLDLAKVAEIGARDRRR